jgi:dTDP-4-amino-4,6-dideoxygalactose transaminase
MLKPRLEIRFDIRRQAHFLFGKPYRPGQCEFMLNQSRSGIFLALRSIDLPRGSRVGVMIYNCHTVMNAVKQSGCEPVFIDVTDEMMLDFDDLKRKVNDLSALVVTHLFGIVNDVKAIKNEFPNLIVIEDCAHAYGIEHLYGDFATFSIGQGKLPSIGDGGLLFVINERFKGEIAETYETLPNYSFLQSVILFFRLCMASFLHRPWLYGWLTNSIKKYRKPSSACDIVRPMKMCKGVSSVYAREKDLIALQIGNRMRNATRMTELVGSIGLKEFHMGFNAFMLVVRCDNPSILQKELANRGVDSATHFANSILWDTEFGYISGQCPNAEKMIKQLLMVPVY